MKKLALCLFLTFAFASSALALQEISKAVYDIGGKLLRERIK
ncbi:hypothetical protein [Synergistes jonesii]|nr:hypothetical protein [Synergistes jonesii]